MKLATLFRSCCESTHTWRWITWQSWKTGTCMIIMRTTSTRYSYPLPTSVHVPSSWKTQQMWHNLGKPSLLKDIKDRLWSNSVHSARRLIRAWYFCHMCICRKHFSRLLHNFEKNPLNKLYKWIFSRAGKFLVKKTGLDIISLMFPSSSELFPIATLNTLY